MERNWFSTTAFTSLEIKQYTSISVDKTERMVVINDSAVIDHFVQRITAIPVEGQIMISFADTAEYVTLTFYKEGIAETVEFIQRRIKTPFTSFHLRNEAEAGLYRDIEALLFPDFSKYILKTKGLELFFPGFSLTYQGSTFVDHAPATVSITTDHFLLRDTDHKEQLLEIHSGQLPPAPLKIYTAAGTSELRTFTAGDEYRLHPYYFQLLLL
jgi:hypothetical protein